MQAMDGITTMQLIPNRYPIFYVDDVTALVPDQQVTVVKYLSHAEAHLHGYDPDGARLAASLVIEMMAQAASVLILHSPLFAGKTAYLAAVNDARFDHAIKAGAALTLTVTMGKVRANMGTVSCIATVQGMQVASAELHFVVQAVVGG